MNDPALRTLTEKECLESEPGSPVRRECVDGFVYAQAGAVRKRGQLVALLIRPGGPRREKVNLLHAGKQVPRRPQQMR